MLHEDAVCPAFDSTLGTHRLDLKFHAPRCRQNLSWDPRSLSKTLHLVNTIAQASSAWRPKGKLFNQFFCSKWLYHEHNETWPAPRRKRSSLEFFSGGGWGWLVQGPVVNQSSLGLLVQVFTTFPVQAVCQSWVCDEGRPAHRNGLLDLEFVSVWSIWGCLQIDVRIIRTCCLQICSLLCHIYDFSNGASCFVLKKKKKWLSPENSKVSLIVWFPPQLFFHFLYFLRIFLFACSTNMRRHQQKWKSTCCFCFWGERGLYSLSSGNLMWFCKLLRRRTSHFACCRYILEYCPSLVWHWQAPTKHQDVRSRSGIYWLVF